MKDLPPLPPDGVERTLVLMERAAPTPNRPRLSTEYELLCQEGDVERAACYAVLEDQSDRMRLIAERLDAGLDAEEHDEDAEAGIVVFVEDEDSLVHYVEDAV